MDPLSSIVAMPQKALHMTEVSHPFDSFIVQTTLVTGIVLEKQTVDTHGLARKAYQEMFSERMSTEARRAQAGLRVRKCSVIAYGWSEGEQSECIARIDISNGFDGTVCIEGGEVKNRNAEYTF